MVILIKNIEQKTVEYGKPELDIWYEKIGTWTI